MKAAKEFLRGYKGLTENGVGRIDRLCAAMYNLWSAYANCKKCRLEDIDRYDLILNIIDGLMGLMEGTEGGFVVFENNDTLGKLEILVKSGGRV